MMLGTDYPENHLPDDDGVGFLAAVTPVLSMADITFGNLEGVLVDGGGSGDDGGSGEDGGAVDDGDDLGEPNDGILVPMECHERPAQLYLCLL